MADSQYDCVVIGSGPGGYVAAIRAAQIGMKTAVIEKDVVGGRCLNVACIPAKAVLRVADVLDEVRDAGEFGIKVAEPEVDFAAVGERRKKVIKTLTGGVSGLFKKNKIDYLEGNGALTGAGSVRVGSSKDGDDADVSKLAERGFKKQGINVLTNTLVENVDSSDTSVSCTFGDQTGEFECFVIAAGRGPDVEGLGLDEAGVKLDDAGLVAVDGAEGPRAHGVWAIGDL